MHETVRETGIYQKLEELNYFIPHPLPPSNPPLTMSTEMIVLYGEASFALGRLNEMSLRLPDAERFIKAYVMKEAMLSSAIEGVHTTLMEIFTAIPGTSKPSKDTQLVLNYTHALDAALNMLTREGLPLVSRVILRAHEILMSGGEGAQASPGNYRRLPVRVGSLVPPPAIEIPRLMGELERYINEPSERPALMRAGLAHVQFETIHPFLDGNGRIGRLLIVLMLLDSRLLNIPILYPSHYFKKTHLEYYQRLDRVRTHGDYEGWVMYYLHAIKASAEDAYIRAKEIESLEATLRALLQHNKDFAKLKDTANLAIDYLFAHPVTSISEMSRGVSKAYNTTQSIITILMEHGLVEEDTKQKRNKRYRFTPYLALLEKEYS